MSLKNYSVLKSQAIAGIKTQDSAHYAVHTVSKNKHFRIAINVKSSDYPPELLYYIDENFQHEILSALPNIDYGFTKLESKPGGIALDYIRQNLFDYHNFRIEEHITKNHNEMMDKFDYYIKKAIGTKDAVIYAFGQSWDNEDKADEYFGFYPSAGIHDIHMNQGNKGKWEKDNGPYQDGALLINFPSQGKWIAIFTAFQSQSFHTDDNDGKGFEHKVSENENSIFIICALLNPLPSGNPVKTISLLNTAPNSIDLNGWTIADKYKNKMSLKGKIEPGEIITLNVKETELKLPTSGGIITLLDNSTIKIHGVSYTANDIKQPGRTIKF